MKVRCRLRWRFPEQTRASCHFANVTNTFDACKRNALTQYTLPQAKNKLWQTYLELFHCKPAKKRKRQAKPLKLPGILQRFSEAWSLGGRTDRRSHFLDRAEPMGGSAQRWVGLQVWKFFLQFKDQRRNRRANIRLWLNMRSVCCVFFGIKGISGFRRIGWGGGGGGGGKVCFSKEKTCVAPTQHRSVSVGTRSKSQKQSHNVTVHSEFFSQILFDFKKSISGPIELKFSGKTLYAIL